MTNEEMQQFLNAELERAKADEKQRHTAWLESVANVERISRAIASYNATPEIEEPQAIRPRRVLTKILAGGKRMTKEEIRTALKAAGWSVTYENRELNKLLNANEAAGNLVRDGHHYYEPDPVERERILRDGRRKKKR